MNGKNLIFNGSKGSCLEIHSSNHILTLNSSKSATLFTSLQDFPELVTQNLCDVWEMPKRKKNPDTLTNDQLPWDLELSCTGTKTICADTPISTYSLAVPPEIQKQSFGIIKWFYDDICQWVVMTWNKHRQTNKNNPTIFLHECWAACISTLECQFTISS